MAGQGRVVERDLRVKADESFDHAFGSVLLADDGERVDLHQVGVVGDHRGDEAFGDPDRLLEVPGQPQREGHLAGLPVEQAGDRMGVDADDRLRTFGRDLLDLHAALRRAHQEHLPGSAVEHRREVELPDDVGRGRDEHLADRDALDLHAQDLAADPLRLVRVCGQLHAAGLAPPADEDLGLHDHLLGARCERAVRCGANLLGRPRDLPGRHR